MQFITIFLSAQEKIFWKVKKNIFSFYSFIAIPARSLDYDYCDKSKDTKSYKYTESNNNEPWLVNNSVQPERSSPVWTELKSQLELKNSASWDREGPGADKKAFTWTFDCSRPPSSSSSSAGFFWHDLPSQQQQQQQQNGQQKRGSLQLWQFLVALLDDPSNATCIAWTGKGMEFKLIEPEEVLKT